MTGRSTARDLSCPCGAMVSVLLTLPIGGHICLLVDPQNFRGACCIDVASNSNMFTLPLDGERFRRTVTVLVRRLFARTIPIQKSLVSA